ncbi:MAG: glycosyltransferase, partial [Actinobacteria bacterium]|nr:glycosyltransferase [Actinomycetota bacterium]
MRRLPVTEASEQTKAAALAVTQEQRVAVVIVAYDAERHIESVLKRLPGRLAETLTEIAVFDDSSNDATYEMALSAGRRLGLNNLHVLRTPHNLGYGGNQKVAYRRAEQERLDVVVLLHGDGQYAPECLWQMLAPFADPGVDAVLGSRMLNRRDALKGHMPLHKWIGNQVLTGIENMVLGSALSEFHTGYRAYRMRTLGKLPYSYNDAGFHFDTEILIQLMAARARIVEVPIPTWYGDEECHVPGVRYALNCIRSVVRYRLFRFGLLYDPFFDCADEPNYVFKQAPNSLHQYVLAHCVGEEDDVLDLGAASGELGARAALKAKSVVAVDQVQPQRAGRAEALALDLNGAFRDAFHGRRFTRVLMLDVLEHLLHPEEVVESVARLVPPEGVLVASTANIGYLVPRLMLLLGQFNYGKRGILDLTHTRLFTISSFTAMLKARGWSVTAVRGFGPPIRDLISTRWPWSMLDSVLSVLARVWPPLFAYNFLVL